MGTVHFIPSVDNWAAPGMFTALQTALQKLAAVFLAQMPKTHTHMHAQFHTCSMRGT